MNKLPPNVTPLNPSDPDQDDATNGSQAPMADGDKKARKISVASLRIDPASEPRANVKELLNVKFGRPSKEVFFRVHPDYNTVVGILKVETPRTAIYVLAPDIFHEVRQAKRATLHLCITMDGDLHLWPVLQVYDDGQTWSWHITARRAVEFAKSTWTGMEAGDGDYKITYPERQPPDPKWPEQSFDDLLEIGLKDVFIDDLDHPVMKRLRGA